MLGKEPARILAALAAGLALAVGFGLRISGQQVNLIMVFASALIPLLAGEVTRSQVTPTVRANEQIEMALTMPASADVKDVIAAVKADEAVEG